MKLSDVGRAEIIVPSCIGFYFRNIVGLKGGRKAGEVRPDYLYCKVRESCGRVGRNGEGVLAWLDSYGCYVVTMLLLCSIHTGGWVRDKGFTRGTVQVKSNPR